MGALLSMCSVIDKNAKDRCSSSRSRKDCSRSSTTHRSGSRCCNYRRVAGSRSKRTHKPLIVDSFTFAGRCTPASPAFMQGLCKKAKDRCPSSRTRKDCSRASTTHRSGSRCCNHRRAAGNSTASNSTSIRHTRRLSRFH